MKRENAGYEIISTVRVSTRDEIVIGYHATAPEPYVVWFCANGDDYYTGAYCTTYAAAINALIARLERLEIRPNATPV